MKLLLNSIWQLFLIVTLCGVLDALPERHVSDRLNGQRGKKYARSLCPHLSTQETSEKIQRNRRDTCHYTQKTCDSLTNSAYRTADGSCNNLNTNTLWGMADTPDLRFMANRYQDGISEPKTLDAAGNDLPFARTVSTKILQDDEFLDFTNYRLTHMIMQWGQFVDHDITRTPAITEDDGSEPICCEVDLPSERTEKQSDLDAKDECFAMPLSGHDRHFTRTCMNFVRSVHTTPLDCSAGAVEQVNLITSYIDASQVYGSSDAEMDILRNGTTGYLKTSDNNLLPHTNSGDHCVLEKDGDFCFKAGDARVNVQPGLMAIQTLFMREHNRIAQEFYDHTSWTGDKIFYETRKILGALIQHITYKEFLPIIMSDAYDDYDLEPTATGFNTVYDDSVDASIRTEFATAAYRFGHSMIQSYFTRSFGSFNESTQLRSLFGRTSFIAESDGDGLNRIINGLLIDAPERADRWYSLEITDRLFQKTEDDALDLGALNVQRGRDHGIATYNDAREFCGFQRATTFDHEVAGGLLDHLEIQSLRLKNTYISPADIDLYPGGISEQPVGGGSLGPTFACLVGKQFEALRKGDRFWYENNFSTTGFTEGQLNSIKTTTLSKIICDNTDISSIQPQAFKRPTSGRAQRKNRGTELLSVQQYQA